MPSMFRSLAIPAAAVKRAQKKVATPVASIAVPVAAAADDIPMRDQEKVGAKCCGCLCDYRRAVVAISIVDIVWNIIAIIIFASGSGAAAVAANADYLDLSEEDQENLRAGTINAGVVAGIYAILLCFSIFSLVAALRYSVCMLVTVVFFLLVQLGWSFYVAIGDPLNGTGVIIGGIIGSIIGYGLCLYPVIGLITEIKSGVMSRETYPREAHSCCCSPKV